MTPLVQTKDRLPTCGGAKQDGTVWGGRWRVAAQSGENSWHIFKWFIHKALSLALGVLPTAPAPCHLTGLQATPSTRLPHPGAADAKHSPLPQGRLPSALSQALRVADPSPGLCQPSHMRQSSVTVNTGEFIATFTVSEQRVHYEKNPK